MKQLVCEMCGGTDLVKQEGLFICQSCNAKYSVEEAKKMMIEGTVEVAGTVKVDRSGSIQNYLSMAQNAYDANNQKEAEDYCNKIIEIDLNNYHAWHLKGRAAGWQSTVVNKRLSEAINCFSKALENCPEDKKNELKQESADEISNLSKALLTLSCNNYINYCSVDNADEIMNSVIEAKEASVAFLIKCGVKPTDFEGVIAETINSAVCTAWENTILPEYKGDEGRPSKWEWEIFKERCVVSIALLGCAITISDNDDRNDVQRYKNLIDITQNLIDSCSWTQTFTSYGVTWSKEWQLTEEAKQTNISNIMEYHQKIKEINPEYIIPEKSLTKAGCFIATAIYGSYDCPQVWTLRRFRDNILAETWLGRKFINIYYSISPVIVKWFGHSDWFNNMWKSKLDKMVAKLQSKGVDDTPYYDINSN